METVDKRIRSILILAVLLLTAGCAALPQILAGVAQGSQYLGSLLDVAESGSDAYFARHPSLERESKVAQAIRRARLAQAALDASVAAAASADDGNMSKARSDALEAYKALRDLLDELGVTSATPPPGGAETEAPPPEPFELPPPDDVGRHL